MEGFIKEYEKIVCSCGRNLSNVWKKEKRHEAKVCLTMRGIEDGNIKKAESMDGKGRPGNSSPKIVRIWIGINLK